MLFQIFYEKKFLLTDNFPVSLGHNISQKHSHMKNVFDCNLYAEITQTVAMTITILEAITVSNGYTILCKQQGSQSPGCY